MNVKWFQPKSFLFCFDAGKAGGRRFDIAQNLHIKTKVCCRWKKYNCGYLFLFDIFCLHDTVLLVSRLPSLDLLQRQPVLHWLQTRKGKGMDQDSVTAFISPLFLVFVLWNHLVYNSGINSCKYQRLYFTRFYSSGVLIWLVFVSGFIRFVFFRGRAAHESLAFALFQWQPCWLHRPDHWANVAWASVCLSTAVWLPCS